jgi:hypothetical protein
MNNKATLIIYFACFLIGTILVTHNMGYDVEIKNFEQVDETTVEWEVFG